ncbi:hypothetical protein K1W54_12395 [Micromonospora sp. CPCC 205371]|nr:hypothetical protein [Micromonospora sp. CPCC 205371]
MRDAYVPGRWIVFRYDLETPWAPSDELTQRHGGLIERARLNGRRHGQPFMLGPDGRPAVRVNAFFASRRMQAKSPLTWKKYAHALGLWLNFLLVLERCWDSATEDDAEYFKEWRLSEESNPRLVESSTFGGHSAYQALCGPPVRR